MRLRELRCENCGASIKVDENVSQAECEFCHTTFAVEDAYHDGYKFEKGRIKAQNEQFEKSLEHVNGLAKPIGKVFTAQFIISAIVFLFIFVIVIIMFFTLSNKRINFNNNSDQTNDVEKLYDEADIMRFNSNFEMYSGTEHGLSVGRLIDNVITNNKKEKEHQITLNYKEISTQSTEKMKEIKNQIDDWTEYEITFEYDENGFIYIVEIDE